MVRNQEKKREVKKREVKKSKEKISKVYALLVVTTSLLVRLLY